MRPSCRPLLALRKKIAGNCFIIHGRTFASSAGNDFTYEGIKDIRLDVPERFNFAQDVIDDFASREDTKDRPALLHVGDRGQGETKWSYSQLSRLSQKAASVLSGMGEVRRAVTVLPKVPQWWLLNVAALRTGTVLLPGTTLLTSSDLAIRMRKSESDAVIADRETAGKVEEALLVGGGKTLGALKRKILVGARGEEAAALESRGWFNFDKALEENGPTEFGHRDTRSSEVIQIFFTSGTTGEPKMVPHTQASYGFCHRLTGRYWLDLAPGDLHWNISDTGWAKSAWSSVFGPWSTGACVFVHGMQRFTPTEVLSCLGTYPITTLCAPPTLYRSLVQEDLASHDFGPLRHCVSAGEPLNEEVINSWRSATGLTIKEGYGQTETTLVSGTFKGFEARPGSMGKPAPGYDVRIVDGDGREVARGDQGNIGIRVEPEHPPGLFDGYLDDLERTERAFSGGFYLTGDRASMDEDGYIWFASRDDDIIISAGYRIGPFEVESALLEHPAVAESAAVASPDPARGHVVKAFVVPTEYFAGAVDQPELAAKLAEELQAFARSRTAPYKYPRKVEFVSSLPKTISGKIKRAELRLREERTKG